MDFKKYDKKENIIMITPYPKRVSGNLTNLTGVATYAHHIVPDFAYLLKSTGRKLILLVDMINDHEEIYEEEGVLVWRCWKKGSPTVYTNILRAILKFKSIQKVFLHFEFNMYGDYIETLKFPIFLLNLKLNKCSVTVLLHQVVSNLGSLAGHINVSERSIFMPVLNFVLSRFYQLVLYLSRHIIVHDDLLRQRLQKISDIPVFVVPHGLGDISKSYSVEEARAHLGIPKNVFVVLCFGYITWYKGSDWIVEQFHKYYKKTKKKDIVLIMAGGLSPNYKEKQHYLSYYNQLTSRIDESPNIILTGFIPEEQVSYYYSASDIVVLPYRAQMSASGPFSVGLSFDRPFMLSEHLSGVLDTFDIKRRMYQLDLTSKDLLFKMTGWDFFTKLSSIIGDKSLRKKLQYLSTSVKNDRLWSQVCLSFLDIIDA